MLGRRRGAPATAVPGKPSHLARNALEKLAMTLLPDGALGLTNARRLQTAMRTGRGARADRKQAQAGRRVMIRRTGGAAGAAVVAAKVLQLKAAVAGALQDDLKMAPTGSIHQPGEARLTEGVSVTAKAMSVEALRPAAVGLLGVATAMKCNLMLMPIAKLLMIVACQEG